MSTQDHNWNFIYGGYADGQPRTALHPLIRVNVDLWEQECRQRGLELKFSSGTRTKARQAQLNKNKSYHVIGLGIDTKIWNGKSFGFNERKYAKQVYEIGRKYGITWGGNFKFKTGDADREVHHFEFRMGYDIEYLYKQLEVGNVDISGYANLEFSVPGKTIFKEFRESYTTEIGKAFEESQQDDDTQNEEIEKKKTITTVTKTEEVEAQGIWGIIKVFADQYSLSQNINDATIAFDQGSLLNFVRKIVQSPWLEFFGDTYGDEYYFNVRKEPFDYNGWTTMTSMQLGIEDVYSDDLSWYDGDIYSWFQIEPKGSYIQSNELILQFVPAVFFKEYAQIWGSKPLSCVTNLIGFSNESQGKILLEKAFEDLRYMVESCMYLPFTRTGTIVLKGDYRWKRGQKLQYLATGEEFFIDGVSHSWNQTDSGYQFTTTLRVTRGMFSKYLGAPIDRDTLSYWNIISFGELQEKQDEFEEIEIQPKSISFFHDNGREYLINLNESFVGKTDDESVKMNKQISDFPNLRNELVGFNDINIDVAVGWLRTYKQGKFQTVGHVDIDRGGRTSVLPDRRAKNIKKRIIDAYLAKYDDETKQTLDSKISTKGRSEISYDNTAVLGVENELPTNAELTAQDNENKLKRKALERFTEFRLLEHKSKKKKEKNPDDIGWSVNSKVFDFFLKRKQNNIC